jgi:hypothetical protein
MLRRRDHDGLSLAARACRRSGICKLSVISLRRTNDVVLMEAVIDGSRRMT